MTGSADQPAPLFTVFTPTYNRGHVLHRAYESMRAQTLRDFEWLVVDNASTDDTAEIVAGWIAAGDVPIRYLRNEVNIGRQGSWTRAIREARGELFTELRSADGLVPQALERLKFHWESIRPAERAGFSAVSALAMDEHGDVIGTRFPEDVFDSDSIEIRYRYKVRGDKWGFQRTSVMRDQQIPEIPGLHRLHPRGRDLARDRPPLPDALRQRAAPHLLAGPGPRAVAPRHRLGQRPGPGDRGRGPAQQRPPLAAGDPRAPSRVTRSPITTSGLHWGRSLAEQPKTLRNPGVKALWLAMVPVGVAFYLVERYLPASDAGCRTPSRLPDPGPPRGRGPPRAPRTSR